ncbi:MAG TPA: family 10 glycosylhydrolase [Clostridia bacterium]|nr:family 10 glycosylhydrolase [Clostridia bacterium]
MRYFKSTLLCICFAAITLIRINVYAADESKISTPAIVFENGSTYSINLIDKIRENESIIVYTRNYGEFTEPFAESTHEYIVVNNIVAEENTNGAKGTYIPSNGYVVSYTGTNGEFLKNLDIGKGFTLLNIEIPTLPEMYFELDGVIVPIDKINSGRDSNKITLYNPSFGASTKTNAWGMELTVVSNTIGKIIDIRNEKGITLDNNSPIPSDGVVISIHSGSPYYKQLHEKAKVTDKVVVTTDNMLYNASKNKYAACNPQTIADNPAAWNIAEGKPYDGFRGPNQLIIYDSSYGSHTGTNPYGYEVVVSNEGQIISTGGNDSEIPKGGYVLSGHGDKLNWLQKYALLGATVVFNNDKKEVTMIFTPDSYMNMALYNINSAQASLELAKKQYLDISYDNVQSMINLTESKLKKIQAQLAQGQYDGLIKAVRDMQKDADTAYYMTFESVKVENRAVWLRPRDTSIVQIQKRLDMLKALNINTIYLETYWNGYAIYPTNNEIMQHNPMFNGLDVLGVYLKEAHARGIELHAWVENFLVDQSIAAKKPEWMAMSRKGDNYYLENGVTKYYFMNPALPEVRDFLSGLYKGLISNYNLDGIQFDYMRYSHSGDYSNDFGYDTYTRQLFTDYTGTDPIVLKPSDALWQNWCGFRAYIVSSYAYRLFSEVKSIKPNLTISSDVWPDYDKTIVDIYQDPRAWIQKDYINNLIPMSYYLYEAPVVDDINNSRAFARGHSQLTSGIAAFNKVDTKVFLRQIAAIRAANTSGIAIFEFESLFSGGYEGPLKLGAFSSPSIVTNGDPEQSIKMVLNELVRKIDDIYIKYGGMDTPAAEKYKKLLSAIKVSFKDDTDTTKAAYYLKHSIEDLLVAIDSDPSLNNEVVKRIGSDLNIAINIIDAYISDTRFMTSHEVREFQVEIPVKVLKNNEMAPLKLKAVFNDNASMYLDKAQYSIKTDNPASVEITGDILKLKDVKERTTITIDILDNFKFNTTKDINKKMELVINQDGKTIADFAYGILKASEVGYTTARLDWGSAVIDSDIAGYAVYRNDMEIARTSSDMFNDRDLQSGENYVYYVHGFDAAGNIVYKSDQVTINTKVPSLLASH